MNQYHRISFVLLFVILGFAHATRGQSNEQMRSQAESALQKMSPDEIDRKIKELGLTREEATRRAAELNISLDDYLTRKGQATTIPGSVPTSETTTMELSRVPTTSRTETALPKKKIEVPGFKQRKGVEDLLPFGYEIFQNPPSTFEPTLNVATPESYQLGPGDEVIITVW